ncbi:MAG: helix-turn-helix domain-containing protein [Anaerolineales bacterium]
MPHSLTPRQSEYLEFIREYINQNESSPRLEEIAKHLGVKSPTAHKTLKGLMAAGYLYFGRSSTSGFFIRLIERAGTSEVVIEIPIAGKVDRYGELVEFPQNHGHFATVLLGANPGEVFALAAWRDIPEASILTGDLLICDYGKRPQPGDMVVLPFGPEVKRLFLCQVHSLTLDQDLTNLESSNPYPIPEVLINKEYGQKLNWIPLAYSEENQPYFELAAKQTEMPMQAIGPELTVATVLRLSRNLAF